MKDRVLRAIPTFTLGFAAMGLVAYSLGRLTRSDWVWWLAPLTVALEGTRLLRARDGAALLSHSDEPIGADPDASRYVASCAIAAAMAAGGAYAGNRLALLTGAALALVGNALTWGEDPAVQPPRRADMTRCCNWQARMLRKPSPLNPLRSKSEGALPRALRESSAVERGVLRHRT